MNGRGVWACSMMPAIESGTSRTKHAASWPLGLPALTRQGVLGTNSRASMMSLIALKNYLLLRIGFGTRNVADDAADDVRPFFERRRSRPSTNNVCHHLLAFSPRAVGSRSPSRFRLHSPFLAENSPVFAELENCLLINACECAADRGHIVFSLILFYRRDSL